VTPSASAPPSTQPAPQPALTLLLVDDEPSVLSALRRLFRTPGYTTLLATSGAEALTLLREHAVDLVISDMRMPGMDGTTLLEAVRLHDPAIVRILLTGYSDISSTIAAINRGAIHRYFSKPWNDQEMLLAVREALSRRDLELHNARLQDLTQRQNTELQDLNHNLEARVAARTAELSQVNAMLEKAYEEVNDNFTLAVTVFSGLMEMRQDGIAGHSRRVASLARRSATAMGLDERAAQDVMLGALLHDIGKIGFPDRMLGKPVSGYGPEDLSRYRRHPLDGEAALLPLARLHGVARIVRQHHERVDGRGFPDALGGEDIVLGARIVAVASDYDGLTSGSLAERVYTPEQAQQILRGGVGTRYDAKAVQALLQVLAQEQAQQAPEVGVDIRQLRPGMVVARDLLSPKGAMLLAAGHVFQARVIRQICELADRENLHMVVHIRRDSMPSAQPAQAGLPTQPTQAAQAVAKS
jgi:response regulator RpfG family c-di-GMP phosphodiesterase